MLCHICNKAQAQMKCPTCSRVVCYDCLSAGVCLKCFAARSAQPQPMSPPLQVNLQPSTLKILGFLFGIFFSLFAVLTGLVLRAYSRSAETLLFARYAIIWGCICTAILVFGQIALCLLMGTLSAVSPVSEVQSAIRDMQQMEREMTQETLESQKRLNVYMQEEERRAREQMDQDLRRLEQMKPGY